MTGTETDVIKTIIWEEIGPDLAKSGDVTTCLCWGDEFGNYLQRKACLPFKLELVKADNRPSEQSEVYDIIVGWQVLQGEGSISVLNEMYQMLKKGGEVRLFGFYRHPVPDDILLWERKCREYDKSATFPLPLPKAISLSQISSWVKSTPFEHYVIRKKGIYYQALLRK